MMVPITLKIKNIQYSLTMEHEDQSQTMIMTQTKNPKNWVLLSSVICYSGPTDLISVFIPIFVLPSTSAVRGTAYSDWDSVANTG